MAGDGLVFLLVGGAAVAGFLALKAWSLGRELRGEVRWARGRPPEWAFALPRFIARLGWTPRILAATLYLLGLAGTALAPRDEWPWVVAGFAGIVLGAWTGYAAVVVHVVEKNREALEAQPPIDVRRRLAVGLAAGGAWTILLAAVGVPLGWFREAPPFFVALVLAYGAAMGVAGLWLITRSRAAAAPSRR